jgi:drug/metabolite transporter (DMT)-like permease
MRTSLLIVVTLIWGSTFVLIKDTFETVDAFSIVLSRTLIAAVAMLGWIVVKRRSALRDWQTLRCDAILGALLFVTYGAASGPIPAIDGPRGGNKGHRTLSREAAGF